MFLENAVNYFLDEYGNRGKLKWSEEIKL